MKQQTAVEYFDEQIQERIIAQDWVARKMIIEISMEDYINIKKQAKQMEKEQLVKVHIDASSHKFEDVAENYYNKIYSK